MCAGGGPIKLQAACHDPNIFCNFDSSTMVFINSLVIEQMIISKNRRLKRGGEAATGWKEKLKWLWRNLASRRKDHIQEALYRKEPLTIVLFPCTMYCAHISECMISSHS